MHRFIPILASLVFSGCYSADALKESGAQAEDPGVEDAPPVDADGDGVTDSYNWDAVPEPELAPGVHVLDDAACVSSVDVDLSPDELTIWTSCAVNLAVGDVVVGTAGEGYLREIVGLDVSAERVVARTTNAALERVLVNGGFEQTIAWDTEERESWDWSGTTLYAGEHAGVDVSLELTRAMAKVDPNVHLAADFGWFSLKRAEARLDANVELDAELRAALAGAVNVSRQGELARYSKPFEFRVGPLPIKGRVHLVLAAGIDAAADGAAVIGGGAEIVGEAHIGAIYEDGNWAFVDDRRFDATRRGPDWDIDGDAQARITMRVEAELSLYGVGGPQFDLDGYAEGEAALDCDTIPWSLSAGVDASADIDLDFLRHAVTKHFGPWEWDTGLISGELAVPFPLDTNCDDTIGVCTAVGEIACGEIVRGDTRDAVSSMSGYPINTGNYEAPELVYQWSGSGEVEFRLVDPQPSVLNHDIVVLDGSGGECSSDQAVAYGFNSLLFTPEGSGPWFVVIDGYDQDAGEFALEVDCSP